jgi:hypothetical protein
MPATTTGKSISQIDRIEIDRKISIHQKGATMKPIDVFVAILKAYGVVLWVRAIIDLVAALRYSPFFWGGATTSDSIPISETYTQSIHAYWQTTVATSVILFVIGLVLIFSTRLFAKFAYGAFATQNAQN